MAHSTKVVASLVGLVWLAPAPAVRSEPVAETKKTTASKFIRIQRDGQQQPASLETSIVRYVPASGEGKVIVDLIGAVHVADRGYYDKLNKQFEQYDVLLYELVAPPGTRIPRGGRRQVDNPLALIQHLMKTVLALELQTEHIDYTRKNFVHADLSPEQMAEAIRNRGEDGLTLFLSIAADVLRQQNLQELQRRKNPPKAEAELDFFSLLLDPDASIKLKRLLAEQLEMLESPEGGLGKTLTAILITDRNTAAMKVLQKEIVKGRKKIGIFYGAAHLPDFEKRLRDDLDLKRDNEQWLTAWDLRAKKGGFEGLLIELLKGLEP